MKKLYEVNTRDVDGSDRRTYQTFEAASKRFEAMSGRPLPLGRREFTTVSDFGCVVSFCANENAPVPAQIDKDYEDIRGEYVSSCGTYGGAEHQAFGDAWAYRDCPGAW